MSILQHDDTRTANSMHVELQLYTNNLVLRMHYFFATFNFT